MLDWVWLCSNRRYYLLLIYYEYQNKPNILQLNCVYSLQVFPSSSMAAPLGGLNLMETELMQNLRLVGFGPSLKTWPK